MPYPVAADLASYLSAHGVGASDLARVDGLFESALESAVAAWEGATGYSPFLVAEDDAETTRAIPAHSNPIELGAGLLTFSALEQDGTALADPYREYRNSRIPERPIHAFGWAAYGYPYHPYTDVTITGLWGACTTLPADVRQAILSIAASSLRPAISGSSFTGGQVTKEKVGEVETTYAAPVSGASGSAIPPELSTIVARYRRPSSGVA